MCFCLFLVPLFGNKPNYVLLIHLGTFDFQNGRFGIPVFKGTCEEGSQHIYFITHSLIGATSLRSLVHLRAFPF